MSETIITIATVCFNSKNTIKRTIKSVDEQDYKSIEHLFIDGASTDGTKQIIEQYRSFSKHEVILISEKDKGLYDAMNKAIRMARGEYIVFLNAGDKLHDPSTISKVISTIGNNKAGVVYGETDIVDNEGNFIQHRRLKAPETLTSKSFLNGMLVCHQSFYANCEIAKRTLYNLNYRFSADVDWCIRIMKEAESEGLPMLNTNQVLTDYLSEGMTTKNHRASLIERFKVMSSHYGLMRTTFQHTWFVVRAILK